MNRLRPWTEVESGSSRSGSWSPEPFEVPDGEFTAVIAHKGWVAETGRYICYVKKGALHPKTGEATVSNLRPIDDEDDDWYRFDNGKVDIFSADRVGALAEGPCLTFPSSSYLWDCFRLLMF